MCFHSEFSQRVTKRMAAAAIRFGSGRSSIPDPWTILKSWWISHSLTRPHPKHCYHGSLTRFAKTLSFGTLRRTSHSYRKSSAKASAICTEFSAAPFLRLSETTHRLRPYSTVLSSRIRLTYTPDSPATSTGVTYS